MIDRNATRDARPAHGVALDAVEAGIEAAQPRAVLSRAIDLEGETLRVGGDEYELSAYDEVVVLGGGNAAGQVAAFLSELLGDRLDGGVVVTDDPEPAGPIETVVGTHPVPSEANVDGARRVLDRARASDENTLALVAVTGGGSALLAAPVEGVPLDDLQSLTDGLLRSGAPIDRINAVRKHVSEIKGGRLARALAPATTVGLVFSDVSGGDVSVVASGPLSPDSTTYADALDVLSEYDVDAPESVRTRLERGAAGELDDTPGPDDRSFETVTTHVVADNFTALEAAREVCADAGFDPLVLSSSVRGEAREAALTHVAIAEEIRKTGNPVSPPAAVLSGGETTVTIRGDGVGGPNQEFALGAAIELPEEATLCAVDTDGIDGPTDAAGAIVDHETVEDRREARARLNENDVYDYLDERDALVFTGQTGTNVNDLRVLLVIE
ncbi:glycerate kinase type-2 family protein [Halobellus rufus]|uniref:glycerate kinase type-2 family protein n=1 Tax=Halobellus rufus TaxID=1448860 RepID=UPI0006790607|nr:glycerate kinase [Halobellus rufus]